jgi:3-deoxy-D-manno-octulosonic-acid transferase
MFFIIWLYRILWLPVFLVSSPYYIWRMLRRGGYAKDFHQRLGVGQPLGRPKGDRIWIQAVSVGEVLGIEPFIDELTKIDGLEIVLTTTTSTGYKIAREKYSSKILRVGIFPLDMWIFSFLAWTRIKPTVVVFMESELWPEHIWRARCRKVPMVLINARMSDRTFGTVRHIPWIMRPLVASLSAIGASSEVYNSRYQFLAGNKVPGNKREEFFTFTGNLKLDVNLQPILTYEERTQLLMEIGFLNNEDDPHPEVILGSSTWPGEEETLLGAYERYKAISKTCRLLIVPRHAERREEIRNLLNDHHLSWHLRSDSKSPTGLVDVYVADTTGELRMFTQLASVAFIGKTLQPNEGGQTPIEAAAYGVPTVFGPNFSNFSTICKQLLRGGASISIPHHKAMPLVIPDLLKHPERLERMSECSINWHQANLGASKRTVEIIKRFMKNSSSS